MLAQASIVTLVRWQTVTLIYPWQRLRLPSIRRRPHELVNLILVRSDRVGVDCIVDVRDVLRAVAHGLAGLTVSLVLGIALRLIIPLVVEAVWLSHHVTLKGVVGSFLGCRLSCGRSAIDEVVIGRLECGVGIVQALTLSLTSNLAIQTLTACRGWIALALSLNLKRRAIGLRLARIQLRLMSVQIATHLL